MGGFKLTKKPEFDWPVSIKIPRANGQFDTEKFTLRFKRLSTSELKDVSDRIESGSLKDSDFAREVTVGWKDVLDESGAQMPFSAEAFEQLLETPGMSSVIVKTYYGTINEAGAKN